MKMISLSEALASVQSRGMAECARHLAHTHTEREQANHIFISSIIWENLDFTQWTTQIVWNVHVFFSSVTHVKLIYLIRQAMTN